MNQITKLLAENAKKRDAIEKRIKFLEAVILELDWLKISRAVHIKGIVDYFEMRVKSPKSV